VAVKYAEALLDVDAHDAAYFISFPSAKDPEYDARHPGTSTCEMLMETTSGMFEQLNEALGGARTTRRTAAYKDVKKLLVDKFRRCLTEHFPHLQDKIVSIEVSTPLSMHHYLQRFSTYGLRHTPERIANPVPRVGTGIRRLYLSGQDLITEGWMAAVYSGMVAATHLLGYTPWDLVSGRLFLDDLAKIPNPPSIAQLEEAAAAAAAVGGDKKGQEGARVGA